jgi:hypothetical protein
MIKRNQNALWRAVVVLCLMATPAYSIAVRSNDSPLPKDGDPSAFTGPLIGDLPDGLPEANEGAAEGGKTGTMADATENNSVSENEQQDNGTFDVPTNGSPSPLYDAEPFTQQLLRFEEFGAKAGKFRRRVHAGAHRRVPYRHWKSFPAPPDAQSAPDSRALDEFLAQDLYPPPTVWANDRDENPWKQEIEDYLGRPLVTPPAEGRPPGQGWSHQRWNEFPPQVWF